MFARRSSVFSSEFVLKLAVGMYGRFDCVRGWRELRETKSTHCAAAEADQEGGRWRQTRGEHLFPSTAVQQGASAERKTIDPPWARRTAF